MVGQRPELIADALAQKWPDEAWSRIVLPGFPPDPELVGRAMRPLAVRNEIAAMVGIVRQIADVSDPDRWWAARSGRFRRNLNRAERIATDRGLSCIDASNEAGLMDRLVAIERHSWKGAEGDGLCAPELGAFYRAMTQRLQPRGECRALIARLDGRDVGFILGAVRGRRYRGLQLSFVADLASLSIGHLLQREQMRRLAGQIDEYDLGMEMEYKAAWADHRIESLVVVCRRVRS